MLAIFVAPLIDTYVSDRPVLLSLELYGPKMSHWIFRGDFGQSRETSDTARETLDTRGDIGQHCSEAYYRLIIESNNHLFCI